MIVDEVFELIAVGVAPADVMSDLGISRYQYDSALIDLTDRGVISHGGELPEDAKVELCPTAAVSSLILDVFTLHDRPEHTMLTSRSLCTRYGIVVPTSADPRYTRANWTGQAFRRVDFTTPDGADFMVVGTLIPRMDKRRWKEATPSGRVVCIDTRNVTLSFVAPRGGFLSSEIVDSALSRLEQHNLASVGLTLAVAWVCEARALFPKKMAGR